MDVLHSGDIVTYTEDYHNVTLFGMVIGYSRAQLRYNAVRNEFFGQNDLGYFNKNLREQIKKPSDTPVSLSCFEVMVFRLGAFSTDTKDMDITKEYVKALLKTRMQMAFDVENVESVIAYNLTKTGYNQKNFENYMIKSAIINPLILQISENVITADEILQKIQASHHNVLQDLDYVRQFIPVHDGNFQLGQVYMVKYKQHKEIYMSFVLCVCVRIGNVQFLPLDKDITKTSFEQDFLSMATEFKNTDRELLTYIERCKKNNMGKFNSYDSKKYYYLTSLKLTDKIDNVIRYWSIK